METDPDLNRISLSSNRSLVIKHAEIKDSGIYYCQSPLEDDVDFNFIVDGKQ